MNKKLLLSAVSLVMLMTISGCTSSSFLCEIDTEPINYPDKIPLKLVVFMDNGLVEKKITTKPLTKGCALWKADLDAGEGYWDAINLGLTSSFDHVAFVTNKRDSKSLPNDNYLSVEARLIDDSASIFVIEELFSKTINTQYRSSMELKFFTKKGDLMYTMNVTGSAASKRPSADCDDMAPILKECVRLSLVQMSNYIAQTAYVAPEFRDYAKKLKK